jgi:hypothetical protein
VVRDACPDATDALTWCRPRPDPNLLAPRTAQRRRWLRSFRALQLAQRTPGRVGSGSPSRASDTWWSAASSPGLTGCAARCQPGQCQPCTMTRVAARTRAGPAFRANTAGPGGPAVARQRCRGPASRPGVHRGRSPPGEGERRRTDCRALARARAGGGTNGGTGPVVPRAGMRRRARFTLDVVGWPTGLEPVTFGATIRCSAD